jgi:PAS domain S-box-containing protein
MNLKRINDISLKWKLIIPFLFMAAIGAASLFLVPLHFQSSLIRVNEDQRLRNLYQVFLNDLNLKRDMGLSLAYLTAQNPEAAKALALRDRSRLLELFAPAYETLHRDFGVRQFHFHLPPATSFLRLHAPEKHGDKMRTFRQTINQTRETGIGVGGIEKGVLGLSIRSVAPVFYQGSQVGTVEFGLSLEKPLLEEFKKKYNADVSLYLQKNEAPQMPRLFAGTIDQPLPSSDLFSRILSTGELKSLPEYLGTRKMESIYGPLRDFSGTIIGLIKISVDREPSLALLHRYTFLAAAMGLVGLLASIVFVWFISAIFTRRIGAVIRGADEIASGRRETRLPVISGDELDVMSRAINRMLGALEDSQNRLQEYAQNLELIVAERTRSLRESEQTYRTLVENVPLIVYMIRRDGETLFLNQATQSMFGLPPETLNGHYHLWSEHIYSEDRAEINALRRESLEKGQELHVEYRLRQQNGSLVFCFDHAVPVFDENQKFYRMDGIIIDVTVQKELQEKNLQTQELETLSQISARLAHELRNPLAAIGGLARRVVKTFEPTDDRVHRALLILEQVQKLEKILGTMLRYISPREVQLKPENLNPIVRQALDRLEKKYKNSGFSVHAELDEALGLIPIDEEMLDEALVNLLENAWQRMNQKGELNVATQKIGSQALITITYRLPHIFADDIEHYFYPFTMDTCSAKESSIFDAADVSIPKVIIFKHGGKISVSKEEDQQIKITISLPLS